MKKILFVCTGNTCRSPMAEALMCAEAARAGLTDLNVKSAGLAANEGEPPSENAVRAMAESGIDISGHTAAQLYQSTLFAADLVFCMNGHARTALVSAGADPDRVFVLGGGISDPFGGDIEVYRRCRDEIQSAVREICEKLRGQGGTAEMTAAEITAARFEDAPNIAAIEKTCFSEPWSEAAVREAMENGTVYFIAGSGGSAVGFAGVKPVLDEGQIANIAVLPEFRGRGIGRALLGALTGYAKAHGLLTLTLEVRSQNAAAISLYESAGFQRVGLRRGYYRDPDDDAVLMTLKI